MMSRRMSRAFLWALTIATALPLSNAAAQDYFGQNAVQYRHFDWQVIETEHFLIHYYPQEKEAASIVARMAERSYARLSRLLDHQFREKKPILLFASRSDFGQNNVTGDLGEGVEGVTEAERQRIILPYLGDIRSTDHVLTHEMTHEFQYDVFGRGRAGGGLGVLQRINPPLWFMEGMAEYLSKGPNDPITWMWMRDAAINGRLPTIQQMQDDPDRYFPYRFGEALFAYIGERWGDEVIGQILAQTTTVGVERAFRSVLGVSTADLSDQWREAMQDRFLPPIAKLERARAFSTALLNPRRTGGGNPFFIAPALSNDGKYIAFISTGNFLKGEVFPDIYLGDAHTGRRIKRLVKSTTNPNFTELQLIYSQNSFSPDGHYLAFTALTGGKDALFLLDVPHRKVVKKFDEIAVDVTSPAWSPDGKQIVFSGMKGGITNLYTVDVAGGPVRQLTNDLHGNLMPQWSPDGKTIAFASDRGDSVGFALLRPPWPRICLLDIDSGKITVLPDQGGININPMWAPDGRSIAYISDRTGTANIFLYDLTDQKHYQLTNVVGGISAIAENSPAITWARGADRLAFDYYENGGYTVWTVENPRSLKRLPFVDTAHVSDQTLAQLAADSALGISQQNVTQDTSHLSAQQSFYRGTGGIRQSDAVTPGTGGRVGLHLTSVAQLLDSAALALPDTTRFKEYPYHTAFAADYVAQPSVGYVSGAYESGLYGGTTIVLSDLVGNSQLAFSGEVNGSFDDAQLFASYTNVGHRLQYSLGILQVPYYFYSSVNYTPPSTTNGETGNEATVLTRYIIREAFAVTQFPINRFKRWELGVRYNDIERTNYFESYQFDQYGDLTGAGLDSIRTTAGLDYVQPYLALVQDNALFGYTGPISGQRYRIELEPALGSLQWMEYLVDYRRYFPILFDFLTFATRVQGDLSIGRNELEFPKYIASPYYVRGYDRDNPFYSNCNITQASSTGCNSIELLGSRTLFANFELRFPLIQRLDLGVLPISLPPLDGALFYDVGTAWSQGQTLDWTLITPKNYNPDVQRYFLSSYGFGLRLNLFNYAIVRWDYAIPVDAGRKGFWRWSIGESF